MPRIFAKKTSLILGAYLLAAGAAFASADPFQAALQNAFLKAKNAFISGQPIYGALDANPTAALVQALNAPGDQDSNAAPRRQELAAFSTTLQNVNTIQTMAAGDGRDPRKIQALISAAAAQWRLTPSEAARCRELYLGGASGRPGGQASQRASAAAEKAAAEQRAGLQKTGAAALASVQGQIAGWRSPGAENIPRAAGDATATTAFPARTRTGAVLPEAGLQTISIPAVPSPAEANQIRDARDVQAAAAAYREEGGTVSNSLAYWRARENQDIRPGESALGYTARITSAKIMAGVLSLSGLPQFEKAVSQYGYLSATDASAGTKVKAAAAAAGRAAVTFVSLGGADGVLGPAFKAGGKLLSKIPQLAGVAEASPEAVELFGHGSDLEPELAMGHNAAEAGSAVRYGDYSMHIAGQRTAAELGLDVRPVLADRVGVSEKALDAVESLGRQAGSTCARYGIAACAIANGRTDVTIGTTLKAAREVLAEGSGEEERLAATVEETQELNQKLDAKGMDPIGVKKTMDKLGLSYESMGFRQSELMSAVKSGDMAEVSRIQSGFLKEIDGQLENGNAVMAAIYTGAKDGGSHAYHAITILGKGMDASGELIYEIFDSNVGKVIPYPADKLYVYGAVVVK